MLKWSTAKVITSCDKCKLELSQKKPYTDHGVGETGGYNGFLAPMDDLGGNKLIVSIHFL